MHVIDPDSKRPGQSGIYVTESRNTGPAFQFCILFHELLCKTAFVKLQVIYFTIHLSYSLQSTSERKFILN
jgi:hypothetical protein